MIEYYTKKTVDKLTKFKYESTNVVVYFISYFVSAFNNSKTVSISNYQYTLEWPKYAEVVLRFKNDSDICSNDMFFFSFLRLNSREYLHSYNIIKSPVPNVLKTGN